MKKLYSSSYIFFIVSIFYSEHPKLYTVMLTSLNVSPGIYV